MKVKVCKKIKLLEKDKNGQFIKTENHKVLRERSVVMESSIAESENYYKMSGVLWVVDEEATKEREDKLNPKKEAPKRGRKPKIDE